MATVCYVYRAVPWLLFAVCTGLFRGSYSSGWAVWSWPHPPSHPPTPNTPTGTPGQDRTTWLRIKCMVMWGEVDEYAWRLLLYAVLRIRYIFMRIWIQHSGSEKNLRIRIQTKLWYGSGSRQKRCKRGLSTRKALKTHSFPIHSVFILLNYHFSINNHLN